MSHLSVVNGAFGGLWIPGLASWSLARRARSLARLRPHPHYIRAAPRAGTGQESIDAGARMVE